MPRVTGQLSDFPRPNVAVDVAVLSVRPGPDRAELVTLVHHRTESPRGVVLPGRFLREGETIQGTVGVLLTEKLRLRPSKAVRPRLLRVFDQPGRDERGWTVSIAHSLGLPWELASQAYGEWLPLSSAGTLRGTKLLFDHPAILAEAVTRMRERYEVDPDPYHLLTDDFSLLELRRLHEAVLGERVAKDTFNRRMRVALEETGEQSTSFSYAKPLPPVASPPPPASRPAASPPMPSASIIFAERADTLPAASGVSMPRTSRPGRPAQLYRHPRRSRSTSDALWRLPRDKK